MGRATILSGGTDGRYTISVDVGAAQKTARLAALTTTIAALTTKISDIQALLNTAEAAVVVAQAALSLAITQYVLATQASPDPNTYADELRAYIAASKTLFNKQATAQPLRSKLAMLQSQKKSAEKDKAVVLAIEVELSRDAWCADFTEDGSGIVATIEIPGESNLILIQPDCPAPIAGDGQLLDRRFMSPEQAFWNASVLPGWQKWRPTYRTGTITNIDYDLNTADVYLDAAISSAQSLNVNQAAVLGGVPVEYMTCNASAFEDGDHVVVRFVGMTQDAPVVVGFVSYPVPCAGYLVQYVSSYNGAPLDITGASQTIYRGQDADEVTAPASTLRYEWFKWDDGSTNRTRHDLNIQEAQTHIAVYHGMPLMELVVTDYYSYTVFGPPDHTYWHWELTFRALSTGWVSSPATIQTAYQELEIIEGWTSIATDDLGRYYSMDAFYATIPSKTFTVTQTTDGVVYVCEYTFLKFQGWDPYYGDRGIPIFQLASRTGYP